MKFDPFAIDPRPIILDLCGGTGSWSKPYQDSGNYNVKVISICSVFRDDVRLYVPPSNVYGILAAPPCTHLALSGARWWKDKGEAALLDALSIADACMRIISVSRPKFWALENPVGRLVRYYGKLTLIFDPCDHGDFWTKKTLVWGSFNLPEKNPVPPLLGSFGHRMAPGPDRARERSKTPSGFANAFYEANK